VNALRGQTQTQKERQTQTQTETEMPPSPYTVALLTVLGLIVASQLCLAAVEELRRTGGRSLCRSDTGIILISEDNIMHPQPPPNSAQSILNLGLPPCSALLGNRRPSSTFSYLEKIRQRPNESDVRNAIQTTTLTATTTTLTATTSLTTTTTTTTMMMMMMMVIITFLHFNSIKIYCVTNTVM